MSSLHLFLLSALWLNSSFFFFWQDSGKDINPSYVQTILSEEASKVSKLPGIDPSHVKIASEYMAQQVKAQWPSDFLTSDLLGYLEGVGTKGGAKASL